MGYNGQLNGHEFTPETAKEAQKKGVAKRLENKERRRLLKEILSEELAKPISKDSTLTKGEWLIMKMVENLRADIKPQDVKILQEVLGESVQKHEFTIDGKSPEERLMDLAKNVNL